MTSFLSMRLQTNLLENKSPNKRWNEEKVISDEGKGPSSTAWK